MHRFNVDNYEGNLVIGYYMIIGRDLTIQIFLTAEFKRQVLQWDGTAVPMKDPIRLIIKQDLTIRKMHEMFIYDTEPVSTRGFT